MALGYDANLRNNRLDTIAALIDAGVSGGLIRIYDGARPATAGAPTLLLAEMVMSDPSFPAAAGGVMSANVITSDAGADATGIATWFRIVDSAGTFVMDGDITSGSPAGDMDINSTAITIGIQVNVTDFILTAGNP